MPFSQQDLILRTSVFARPASPTCPRLCGACVAWCDKSSRRNFFLERPSPPPTDGLRPLGLSLTSLKNGLRRTLPERISTAFRRCCVTVTDLEMAPSWLWESATVSHFTDGLAKIQNNSWVFDRVSTSYLVSNTPKLLWRRPGVPRRTSSWSGVRLVPNEKPTRVPLMILVFYASLAPRD